MIEGIDISHWQPHCDWPKIAVTKRFAICKRLHGTSLTSTFANQILGASGAGMSVGCYDYFLACSPPTSGMLRAHLAKGLPEMAIVALDVETPDTLGGLERTCWDNEAGVLKQVLDLIAAYKAEFGEDFNLYCGAPVWYPRGPLNKFGLNLRAHLDDSINYWWAAYTSTMPEPTFADGSKVAIGLWQYSGTGRVVGIDVQVDLDRMVEPDGTATSPCDTNVT